MFEEPGHRFRAGVDMPLELLGIDVGGAAGFGTNKRRGEVRTLPGSTGRIGHAFAERFEGGGERIHHRTVADRAPPISCIRASPARNASRIGRPLDAPSPAAAKKMASRTPDEPPIVWLSSWPMARKSCV